MARDGAQVSATTAARQATDPARRLAAAADMFTDALARFHERTADLFDEEVSREQREQIGQAVCEFTDRSTDPRTVQQHFEAAYPEADFRLLFDASANAWCPEHAGLLLTG